MCREINVLSYLHGYSQYGEYTSWVSIKDGELMTLLGSSSRGSGRLRGRSAAVCVLDTKLNSPPQLRSYCESRCKIPFGLFALRRWWVADTYLLLDTWFSAWPLSTHLWCSSMPGCNVIALKWLNVAVHWILVNKSARLSFVGIHLAWRIDLSLSILTHHCRQSICLRRLL